MNEKVHDYHDGNRQFQDRFDTRRLADHLTGRVTETIGESQKEFIEKADMFFPRQIFARKCIVGQILVVADFLVENQRAGC